MPSVTAPLATTPKKGVPPDSRGDASSDGWTSYLALQLELAIVGPTYAGPSVLERLDLQTRSLPLGLRSSVIHSTSSRPKGGLPTVFGKESVQVLDPDSVHRNPTKLTDDNTNIHNKLNPVNRPDQRCKFLPSARKTMASPRQFGVGVGLHAHQLDAWFGTVRDRFPKGWDELG